MKPLLKLQAVTKASKFFSKKNLSSLKCMRCQVTKRDHRLLSRARKFKWSAKDSGNHKEKLKKIFSKIEAKKIQAKASSQQQIISHLKKVLKPRQMIASSYFHTMRAMICKIQLSVNINLCNWKQKISLRFWKQSLKMNLT